MSTASGSIVCMDGPDCAKPHGGGMGGVALHPPVGARISGDEPLIDEPDSIEPFPVLDVTPELSAPVRRLQRRVDPLGRVEVRYPCPRSCHGFGPCTICHDEGGVWRRPSPYPVSGFGF